MLVDLFVRGIPLLAVDHDSVSSSWLAATLVPALASAASVFLPSLVAVFLVAVPTQSERTQHSTCYDMVGRTPPTNTLYNTNMLYNTNGKFNIDISNLLLTLRRRSRFYFVAAQRGVVTTPSISSLDSGACDTSLGRSLKLYLNIPIPNTVRPDRK